MAQAALFTSNDVDVFAGAVGEKIGARNRNWRHDWSDYGCWYIVREFVIDFGFGKVGSSGRVGDGDSGFFAGWAIVNVNPTAFEPEINLIVARLFFGRHLEKIDFDLFATVKVGDDGITELGKRARSDIATDVVFVFIHKEEDIGAIDVLVEGGIDVSVVFGKISFFRNDVWVVDDFVATTFEVATPIGGTFLKLGAPSNN